MVVWTSVKKWAAVVTSASTVSSSVAFAVCGGVVVLSVSCADDVVSSAAPAVVALGTGVCA